jgi:hypothetical protein
MLCRHCRISKISMHGITMAGQFLCRAAQSSKFGTELFRSCRGCGCRTDWCISGRGAV